MLPGKVLFHKASRRGTAGNSNSRLSRKPRDIGNEPKYKRRSTLAGNMHARMIKVAEHVPKMRTRYSCNVTPRADTNRGELLVTRRVPGYLRPYGSCCTPFSANMCTVTRPNGDGYRHNRSRGYTQKYSVSRPERCNRVFPHHDTLKRCQVLHGGHSFPCSGHRTTGHCPLSSCPRLFAYSLVRSRSFPAVPSLCHPLTPSLSFSIGELAWFARSMISFHLAAAIKLFPNDFRAS